MPAISEPVFCKILPKTSLFYSITLKNLQKNGKNHHKFCNIFFSLTKKVYKAPSTIPGNRRL
jgi:hypothetical protein